MEEIQRHSKLKQTKFKLITVLKDKNKEVRKYGIEITIYTWRLL